MTAKLEIVTESGVEIDVPLNKLKPFSFPSPQTSKLDLEASGRGRP